MLLLLHVHISAILNIIIVVLERKWIRAHAPRSCLLLMSGHAINLNWWEVIDLCLLDQGEFFISVRLKISSLMIYFGLNYILSVKIEAIIEWCGIFDEGVSAAATNLSIILYQVFSAAKISYILNRKNRLWAFQSLRRGSTSGGLNLLKIQLSSSGDIASGCEWWQRRDRRCAVLFLINFEMISRYSLILHFQVLFHSLRGVDHQEFPVVLIQSGIIGIRGRREQTLLFQDKLLTHLIDSLQWNAVQVLLHCKVTFLNIPEKFLRMGPSLRTRSSPYVILDLFPVLAVKFESLKKSQMLGKCPPPISGTSLALCIFSIFLQVGSACGGLRRRRSVYIVGEQCGGRCLWAAGIFTDEMICITFLRWEHRIYTTGTTFGLNAWRTLSRLGFRVAWLHVFQTVAWVSLVREVFILLRALAKKTSFFILFTSSKCVEVAVFSHLINAD